MTIMDLLLKLQAYNLCADVAITVNGQRVPQSEISISFDDEDHDVSVNTKTVTKLVYLNVNTGGRDDCEREESERGKAETRDIVSKKSAGNEEETS